MHYSPRPYWADTSLSEHQPPLVGRHQLGAVGGLKRACCRLAGRGELDAKDGLKRAQHSLRRGSKQLGIVKRRRAAICDQPPGKQPRSTTADPGVSTLCFLSISRSL